MTDPKTIDPEACDEMTTLLKRGGGIAEAVGRVLKFLDELAEGGTPGNCTLVALNEHVDLCVARDPNESVVSYLARRTEGKKRACRIVSVDTFKRDLDTSVSRDTAIRRLTAFGWLDES